MTEPVGPFARVAQGVRVSVRVTPKASRDKVEGLVADSDGHQAVKVSVTVVPEDGKANDAVIKLLSKTWRIPKTSLSVVQGQTSRTKVLLAEGDGDALLTTFDQWLKSLTTDRR